MHRRHLAHARRRGRAVLAGIRASEGQSTVEYLLILAAFVAAISALGLLWHAGRDGVLVGLATSSASHGLEQGTAAMLKDILAY